MKIYQRLVAHKLQIAEQQTPGYSKIKEFILMAWEKSTYKKIYGAILQPAYSILSLQALNNFINTLNQSTDLAEKKEKFIDFAHSLIQSMEQRKILDKKQITDAKQILSALQENDKENKRARTSQYRI